ncbi:Negative regulator of sexual conjugation and meiosis [Psilocybe cubensis]|uniref:Protein kinase domain-containing protein n=2 Tax=Psilocybe cubensis TaxID=181762 RepID=A0A8H7Y2N3_PSICU|nr:Negative regulator of sexual conjugation and meiosis [Psilocybe cubensis]KAH9481078.1 Negative regulator of sexual conjugation and meiosis [Psilocybe cubensis]
MPENAQKPATTHFPPAGAILDNGALKLVEVQGLGIYRAQLSPRDNRPYAVRCLVFPDSPGHCRQMLIRGVLLHQLASDHIGIATLHRAFKQDGMLCVLLESASDDYMSTQIFQRGRYLGDNFLIKDIFLQLIDAVEYIHSLGIYHRNLNPASIVTFEDGFRVAITDFGQSTTWETLSEEFNVGNVFYMAPGCHGGQLAPEGRYYPRFSDIWSLGIIFLNITTGRNPWRSATLDDPAFAAYLQNPSGFLASTLPVSRQFMELLVEILAIHSEYGQTVRELRIAIKKFHNFYSDIVMFEDCIATLARRSEFPVYIYDEFLDVKMNSYPRTNLIHRISAAEVAAKLDSSAMNSK